MKKLITALLCLCMLLSCAAAEEAEILIVLSDKEITVDGQTITEDASAAIYLTYQIETHKDVAEELVGIENRVLTITAAGTYRLSGTARDTQIAVKAGDGDAVRLILDGVDIACGTAPAIVVYSALDPGTAGEYGVTIELATGSENLVTASHTVAEEADGLEFDGAIDSLVSLGFEGTGSLIVDADNEGIEVQSGHLTINGGHFRIQAGDDPLNVSEDGVGVLTVNDGYVYSSVKPMADGEGDGMDSNGYIVFNGGTAINLAHPASQDSGIDSDMGSTINGGIIVGAGNMYDAIDSNSAQLFMMLEFSQATDDLVVVTDENDVPVFAYDFPYDYMYIVFSTPALEEGATYRVYLGGEIEGDVQDGLYTNITSYVPGTLMQHGGGTAQPRMSTPGMDAPEPPQDSAAPDMPSEMNGMPEMQRGGEMGGFDSDAAMDVLESIDLNTLLENADLNALLDGKDLNGLLTGFKLTDLLTDEQLTEFFGDADLDQLEAFSGMSRKMDDFGGGMHSMESSAQIATSDFVLTRGNTGFTNITAAQ